MRHAGQGEIGDFPARIEIHHLAADGALRIVARGAHDFVVTLGEIEVVEIIVKLGTLRIEEAGYEGPLLVLEVVDHAGRDVVGLRVVRDLPDLFHILESGDKALARRGVVDGRYPRTGLAVLVRVVLDADVAQQGIRDTSTGKILKSNGMSWVAE